MLRSRTARIVLTLFVLDVVLFMLSGIPRYKNAKHGADYVFSEIIWLGFLVGALSLLVTVAVWITRTTKRRRATS